MFAALKSLLSNHVAPGAALVTISPFSCLVAHVTITTAPPTVPDYLPDLEDALGYLDADELVRGRTAIERVIEKIRPTE